MEARRMHPGKRLLCGLARPRRPVLGCFPKEENASTLSQILMDKVPPRFYLSPRACQGILRRASEHGRVLPEVLRLALEQQAQSA